jgi:hypothetical protein
MATPAARVHASGYSSSQKKKSRPYTMLKDEVTPASGRQKVTVQQPKT